MSRYVQRARLEEQHLNQNAKLPYNLTVKQVASAVNATYEFLYDLNSFLVGRGYSRLEEIMLGNSFAGLLSEVMVKNLAETSPALVRNEKIGGHPDLLPVGVYEENEVLHGEEGIEIKSSKQPGGWQGHNPEAGWLMIFRYTIDTEIQPVVVEWIPTSYVEILVARLDKSDWNFSGRRGASRRTITASINKLGMQKLRANPIYRHPDFAVGRR